MLTSGVTGVLGQSWRADVTPHGSIHPRDESAPLDWHIAADDRWHSPASEVAVRQRRLHGAPVFETRVAVPGGDVVQRVWSVPEAGGLTLVDVTNESPLPVACALTRADLLTARPLTDVPARGIDLPDHTIVLPIGHRSSVTVALAHSGARSLPSGLASPDTVARGWVAMAERASRLVLPDEAAVASVVAARCQLLLDGLADAEADPIEFVIGVDELIRMGELGADATERLVGDVAMAVETVAGQPGWDVDAALDSATRVLAVAGELRAVEDLQRIVRGRRVAPVPLTPPQGLRAVPAVERRLLRDGALLPDAIPEAWRGAELEGHGLVAGARATVSFAVRWHGPRPAVLWHVDGGPIELTAPAVDPSWRTTQARGEALWPLTSAP